MLVCQSHYFLRRQTPQIFWIAVEHFQLFVIVGKSVGNLFAAIDDRRRIPLNRFIYALGIRQVGEATARLLARVYGTLDAWRGAMTAAAKERAKYPDATRPNEVGEAYAELCNVESIGMSMADDICRFFSESHNIKVIRALEAELTVEGFATPVSSSAVAGSVSKKPDYGVVGADAGSKAKKARELGVKTLSEQEWRKLVG